MTYEETIALADAAERDIDNDTDRSPFGAFRVGDLRAAFDRVAPAGNWKGPIACTCPGELVNMVCAAIVFFTGSTPRVDLDVRAMEYHITADGYYAACGA
jgi:hypothetical protein